MYLHTGHDMMIPLSTVVAIVRLEDDERGRAAIVLKDGRIMYSPLTVHALKRRWHRLEVGEEALAGEPA